MKNRNYAVVTVNKKGTIQVQNGHPWIYGSDTISVFGDVQNGDIVDAVIYRGGRQYTVTLTVGEISQ